MRLNSLDLEFYEYAKTVAKSHLMRESDTLQLDINEHDTLNHLSDEAPATGAGFERLNLNAADHKMYPFCKFPTKGG